MVGTEVVSGEEPNGPLGVLLDPGGPGHFGWDGRHSRLRVTFAGQTRALRVATAGGGIGA